MIIKYILDKTPQSLNVLSSNLHSAEIYIEFELLDQSIAKINYLIKSPNRLIIDSVDLHVGADFGLSIVQIVQDISKNYQISIGKVFFSEESVFEILDQVTEDQLSKISWNSDFVFYLIRNKSTCLGVPVLHEIIRQHSNGVVTKIDLSFDFGFMTNMNPNVITNNMFQKMDKKIPLVIRNLICSHYLLCYKVSLLRERIFGARFNIKVGVTETRLDLIEKKNPKIIGLSYLQNIVCKNARDKVELKEKRFNKTAQFKLMMDRQSFYDLVSTHGQHDRLTDVMDMKIVYAEFLGKKVFYLVDSEFYRNLCAEFRFSLNELDDDSFDWLMCNLVGELCQQSAQRTIYHSITVHDHPTDINVLKAKAMRWFRSKGYRGHKLSVGHLATYIYQNENYELYGAGA